jgi:hypothetical protein
MGQAIKEMDPNDHMVSTHVSGDYTTQNEEICRLPEMDLCAVDAYHNSPDPLHIVQLMRETAVYNNAFGKPVLITEFGGSSQASNLEHLGKSLHAALWASPAIPIGGTPMFWWWGLIEEENFYVCYQALSRFMADEDRRDPTSTMIPASLRINGVEAPSLRNVCLRGKTLCLGWIYDSLNYGESDPRGDATIANLHLVLSDMERGSYAVEFWDTTAGRCLTRDSLTTPGDTLDIPVPPFARDIAFKIKPLP